MLCCSPRLVLKVISQPNVSAAAFMWRSDERSRYLTVVAKATFDLEPQRSPLSDETEALRGFDPQSVDDVDSDRVPYKVRSEVIVTGSAHAPDRKPTNRFLVRVVVGGIDKSVGIVSERRLTREGKILEGAPITKVELGWNKAAQGATNPIGRSNEVRDTQGMALLPCLVPPADLHSERADGIASIGLGPIPSHWSPRREMAGSRGGPYQDGDALVLTRDLDHAFFQVAPWDQQQQLTFDADARIVLENLHPKHSRLVTNLQPLYVASNIRSKVRNEERALSADTLVIDAERGRCMLVYRTAIAIGAQEVPEVEVVAGPSPASAGRAEQGRGPRRAMPSLTPFKSDPGAGGDEEITHTGAGLSLPNNVLPFDHGAPKPAAPNQFETAEYSLDALQPSPSKARGTVPDPGTEDVDDTAETGQHKLSKLAPQADVPAKPSRPAPPAPRAPSKPPAPKYPPIQTPSSGTQAPTPPKPPPASTLFGAGRAPGSALEASNDASARKDGGGRPKGAEEPRLVEHDAQPAERRRLELLWSVDDVAERLTADADLMRHLEKRSARRQLFGRPTAEDPTDRSARDAMLVLAEAEPTRPTEFEGLRARALRQDRAAPPLCTVRGDLALLFDEQEALRATIGFAAPFNRGDRGLKEAIEMGEAIADSEWSVGSTIDSAIHRVREQLARVARELTVDVQKASVTRKLLEKRKFRTAVALGGDHVRADFLVGERATPVPMYLPIALKDQLPFYERLPISALVEVRARQDEADTCPHALSVLALARDLDAKLSLPPPSADARVARSSTRRDS